MLYTATLSVAKQVTTIRGSMPVPTNTSTISIQDDADLSNQQRRRHLLQGSTCTLYKKCITFQPTAEHPKGHHKDSWVCELSEEDKRKLNLQFVDIEESDASSSALINVTTSGESTMTISEAIIDSERPQMFIPEYAHVEIRGIVQDETHERSVNGGDRGSQDVRLTQGTGVRRQLVSRSGTLKTLVVRVSDRNNVEPDANIAKLNNDVFDDAVSLKTQTEACSYGKLKIEPFRGNTPSNKYISNGIVDVKIDYDINGGADGMDQAALRAANEQLGDLSNSMFDLVMFCFPPGKSNFLAFAYPNSKYSFYNNEWCGYVGAQMHEVGHNLGLAHSGEVNENEYGDGTGMMGSTPGLDDVRMCYNPQKSFQLGWYKDKSETIDPLDGSGNREFVLNGVSDYKKSNDAIVVLRLKQMSKVQDYYVGYNRATGINRDTGEDADMVTIVRKEYGAHDQYGLSIKVASLKPGQRAVINNFNGDRDVQVAFIGVMNGDARIMILDNNGTPPTPPGNCQKVTIELTTDEYPSDNQWFIADTNDWGRVGAISMSYTQLNKTYRQEVCLPMGRNSKTYRFTIFDKYGDGMCCTHGQGSYKAYDDIGRLIFSGGADFEKKEHLIEVRPDPNPPPRTAPPTNSPTSQPTPSPPCETYSIKVKTDGYPFDTKWKFVNFDRHHDEVVKAQSPDYYVQDKLYTHNVCLSIGTKYEFQFVDTYEDGICCGGGQGYYEVINSCGNVIIDSGKKEEKFEKKTHIIEVDGMCSLETPPPTQPQDPPTSNCRNLTEKKRIKIHKKGRKADCKTLVQSGKCNRKIRGDSYKGKFVREVCAKSCGMC